MKKEEGPAGPEIAIVVFRLGDEDFGVPILQVREIIRLEGVTRVPRADADVEGVINLRGQLLTIIDLRRRLGFPPRPIEVDPRIVVAQMPGSNPVGAVVDAVTDVMRISADLVEAAPPLVVTEQSQKYLTGVAKVGQRLIIMCDLAALLVQAGAVPTGAAR